MLRETYEQYAANRRSRTRIVTLLAPFLFAQGVTAQTFSATVPCERGSFTFENLRLHKPSLIIQGQMVPVFAGELVNNTDSKWVKPHFRLVSSGINPQTGKREERTNLYSHESIEPGERIRFEGYAALNLPYLEIDTVTGTLLSGKRHASEIEIKEKEEAKRAEREAIAAALKERRDKSLLAQKAYLAKVPKGKWRTAISKSEFDDSQTVTLSLPADRPISGWPNKVVVPILIARCKEGTTGFFVSLGLPPQPESRKGVTVRYRLDKDAAVEERVSTSSDGNAIFFEAGRVLLETVEAEAYATMLFEFTPFNKPPQSTVFDLRGLGTVIGPLKKACDW